MIRRAVSPAFALCLLSACNTARMQTAREVSAVLTAPRARTDIIGAAQCVGSFVGLADVAGQVRAILAEHRATAALGGGF